MRELLTSGLKTISDSGNPLISKIIMYFGAGSIAGGTVQTIANNTTNEIIQQCVEMTPDWLSYVPAIGVASLVIKNACDIYFKRIEVKRVGKD